MSASKLEEGLLRKLIAKKITSIASERLGAEVPDNVLDSFVHDVKSLEGSEINNAGFDAQLEYLLESGADVEDICLAIGMNVPRLPTLEDLRRAEPDG